MAERYGGLVPFLRPAEIAGDATPMRDVIGHAIHAETAAGHEPEVIILLQPTSPLRSAEEIRAAAQLLRSTNCDSVVSVSPVPLHLCPDFVFRIEDGSLRHFLPEGADVRRRQDVRPAWYRNGTVYAFWRKTFERFNDIYGQDCRPLFTDPARSITIDTLEDFEAAEALVARSSKWPPDGLMMGQLSRESHYRSFNAAQHVNFVDAARHAGIAGGMQKTTLSPARAAEPQSGGTIMSNEPGFNPLLRHVGSLRAEVSASRTVRVDLSPLSPGVHEAEGRFFKLGSDGRVEWLVSQVCDHAAGRLIVRPGQEVAVCPLHGWTLDLETLRYRNVGVNKERLPFEQEGSCLEFKAEQQRLVFPSPARPASDPLTVRFITHATLLIEAGGLRLMTDPWLIGPAFLTGWWLQHPPKDDCLDLVASCDAIYVSHNHPDHCHLETLSLVARDKPILVPDFASGSAANVLRAQGFTHVMPLPFRDVFTLGSSGLQLSILKSGDFRDDSGLVRSLRASEQCC